MELNERASMGVQIETSVKKARPRLLNWFALLFRL
jgi:hypothetical protein